MLYIACMQKNDAQYNEVLNRVLKDWAAEELQRFMQAARDAKIKEATGQSMRSFDVQVIRAGAGQLARVLFAFDETLRFFDMRRMNWTNQRTVEEIREWVQQKGLQKFRNRYKRRHGSIPADNVRFLNAVAWAIVKGKKKGPPRRKWYNKQKGKGIGVLYYLLLDEIAKAHIQDIKKTFK